MLRTEVSFCLLVILLFCWGGEGRGGEKVSSKSKPTRSKKIKNLDLTWGALLFCFNELSLWTVVLHRQAAETQTYYRRTSWLIFYEVKISIEISDITQNTIPWLCKPESTGVSCYSWSSIPLFTNTRTVWCNTHPHYITVTGITKKWHEKISNSYIFPVKYFIFSFSSCPVNALIPD